MQTIIHLPDHIVSKIAAGEVIERPAFAVKELVENAIDAHADVIEIHVEEAGRKRIHVIDNGEGMSKEDLEISFLPHTTSKLKGEELIGIKTLGFRGEALSSIAAISDLTIQSRTSDSIAGTTIKIRNSSIEETAPIGMPIGTIITVDNLFANVPARKKFLKTEKTEFRHITDVVMHYALAYPEIHFVLTHNKKTIFDLPKKDDPQTRIKILLGEIFLQYLFPIIFEDGYIKLSGFLGHPQIASRQNQKQYIFINNRFVTDKLISLAVREAFGTLLPSPNTPVFLLHLTLPHEIVDVNIHPRKEHVAFVNAKELFDTVKLAVSQILSEYNITFSLAKFKEETSLRAGETPSFAGQLLKEAVLTPSVKISLSSAKILAQVNSTYIVVPTHEGITLIDQHAAHERSLYEQFTKAFNDKKQQKQTYHLKKILTLQLSFTEAQVFDEYMAEFQRLGFGIDHFQGTTYIINEAPIIFKGRDLEKIIRDMLIDLSDDRGVQSIDTRSQRMLAYLSCRAAVKAGDILSGKQMKDLVKELEKTQNNATCPHGRPTKVNLDLDTIHKMFRRK